jgi:hypothetical protein
MPPRTGERIAAVLLALALPVLATAAGTDTVFVAELDRDEVALGETATLQITLQAPSEPTALELPGEGMKDLEVVSRGQSTQTSVSFINGRLQSTQTRIFQIVLNPTRAGTLTVPSASCMVQGKRYTTRPLQLRVTSGTGGTPGRAQAPPGPPQPDDVQRPARPGTRTRNPERGLSVKIALDKNRAWLGEQVTASIYVYSPAELGIQLAGSRQPALDGFWAEELKSPNQATYQTRSIDGVPYHVYLLKQLALFPTRAGKLTVDPIELDLVAQVPSGDPFDFFPTTRKVVRRSEPVSIEVRPLPSTGAPPGFQSVNVGAWKLEGSVSEQQVPAGQPVTFRLEASGRGSLRSLTLPKLSPQPGLKLFDPTVKDQVSIDGDRFGGTKVVETVLVAERTGELVLPPLEWSYFEPASGTYKTARTSEVRLTVTPGAPGGAPAAAGVNTLTAGLRPLHSEGDLSKGGSAPWNGPLFALLLLGPVVLFAGMVAGERVRDRLRSGDGERRVRRAGRKARRRLAAARKLASGGDAAAFHAEVARALIGYAADKLGRSAQGLTRDELARELTLAGAHPPAVAALSGALDACDAGRFGMGAATRGDVLRAAERAMEMLEEAEWRRPREVA